MSTKKTTRSTTRTTTTKPASKPGLTFEQKGTVFNITIAAEDIQRTMEVLEFHIARVILRTGTEQQRENALIALFSNVRSVMDKNRTVRNAAAELAGAT